MGRAEQCAMHGKKGMIWTYCRMEELRRQPVTNFRTVEFIVEKEINEAEIEITFHGQRAGNVKQVIRL